MHSDLNTIQPNKKICFKNGILLILSTLDLLASRTHFVSNCIQSYAKKNQLNQFPTNRRLEFKGFFPSPRFFYLLVFGSFYTKLFVNSFVSFACIRLGPFHSILRFCWFAITHATMTVSFFIARCPLLVDFFFVFFSPFIFVSFKCVYLSHYYGNGMENFIDELEGNVQLDGSQVWKSL